MLKRRYVELIVIEGFAKLMVEDRAALVVQSGERLRS